MYSQIDLKGTWLESVEEAVRRASQRGVGEIAIHQSRRYLNYDMVSIDGRWYPVLLNTSLVDGVYMSGSLADQEPKWLDDNGRYINE